jgi:hypothetical protein
MNAHRSRGIALLFFNLASRFGLLVNATPRLLYSWEWPRTSCLEGWVGPRGTLGGCGRFRPLPGFEPLIAQSVANGYNDYAILARSIADIQKIIQDLRVCPDSAWFKFRKTICSLTFLVYISPYTDDESDFGLPHPHYPFWLYPLDPKILEDEDKVFLQIVRKH